MALYLCTTFNSKVKQLYFFNFFFFEQLYVKMFIPSFINLATNRNLSDVCSFTFFSVVFYELGTIHINLFHIYRLIWQLCLWFIWPLVSVMLHPLLFNNKKKKVALYISLSYASKYLLPHSFSLFSFFVMWFPLLECIIVI